MRTSEEDCVRALRRAANTIGRSPSKTQYEGLGFEPASGTIMRVMGGWNAAKEAAGLETYDQTVGSQTPIKPKPNDVELPDGHDWEALNPQQRWYYKNRDRRIAVKSRRKTRLREWLNTYKREQCRCSRCGESHPACLDFHHLGEKRMGVSAMVTLGYARQTVLEEIESCEVLCANCHRKEHHDLSMEDRESDND